MILVNGVAADGVAATDRGLAYGDGVFRTLLLRRGRPLDWQRHYRKLVHDCAALGIPCTDEPILAAELARLAARTPDAVAKIIVTRGSGERGYALPERMSPTRIVLSAPLPAYPDDYAATGVEIRICDARLSFQPRLAGIKHLNRLENVIARAEWSDPRIVEGILLDAEGNAIGGTMTNLFIAEKGELVTPELTRCGVAGVTRARIMEAAEKAGVRCRQESIPLARLLDAEEVMLVNSVIGMWRVRRCADRQWKGAELARRVGEWLGDEGN